MFKNLLRNIINNLVWCVGNLRKTVKSNNKGTNKLLIISIDGIGDLVFFTPAFQYLEQNILIMR